MMYIIFAQANSLKQGEKKQKRNSLLTWSSTTVQNQTLPKDGSDPLYTSQPIPKKCT